MDNKSQEIMKRTKSNLAKTLQISTGHLSDLFSCRRSAGYPLAKKIVEEIGSCPELWLRGGTGTPERRHDAYNSWKAQAKKENA